MTLNFYLLHLFINYLKLKFSNYVNNIWLQKSKQTNTLNHNFNITNKLEDCDIQMRLLNAQLKIKSVIQHQRVANWKFYYL